MERTGCLTGESLSGAQLVQPSDYFQLKMTLKFNSHLNFDGDSSLAKNIQKKILSCQFIILLKYQLVE